MARVTDHDTTEIFAAADSWRDRCLVRGNSLLWPGREVWSLHNLQRFKACFIDNPDTAKDKGFEEKFRAQLGSEDEEVTRLACELLYVYLLYPTSVGAWRKKDLIKKVAGWKQVEVADDNPCFRAFEDGIGNPGLVYNTGRPNELTYLARFALSIHEVTAEDRTALLADHRRVRDRLDDLAEAHRDEFGRPPQLRHILLYLLFPDQYERIASEGHKGRIADAFGEILEGTPPDDVDDQLKAIRDKLEEYLPGTDLDFYWEPLRQCWYVEDGSDTLSPLQALNVKKQIVLFGPPGTGKTFQAAEIANGLIRQHLLRMWGPKEFFGSQDKVRELVETRVTRVQFHPGYGYEDFIRGVHINAGGATGYRDGVLLATVSRLESEPDDLSSVPFVMIIDEMNRADLSKVLGECFSLMEDRDAEVHLGGYGDSRRAVRLPDSLHFIGTMNLIDQSLENVDFALRRRFLWFLRGFSSEDLLRISETRWSKLFQSGKVRKPWDSVASEFEELADRAQRLNDLVVSNSYLGPQYQIGHTYFCDTVSFAREFLNASERRRNRVLFSKGGAPLEPVIALWRYSLQPLLEQYLSGVEAAERATVIQRARAAFVEGSGRA